ncbi:GNAT family N-acetyltransferase [Yinghuangia sp. ASG 101]|uniref:GNAT family N-acetyltransferase n=1 Tax=Yinghuangia sp. ASG 101 TaxID=2896848 RepID=UPI001E50324C|nr:GNAT family N-acetyltransferase [Yinghuangia sp. ASG 101]UGQ12890.1 GNAT family N-acetyltransferase [Yinghuangia sp. ASG 101]
MIRTAVRDDVPTILRFIRELAAYERSEHEVRTTEDDLARDLFGPHPAAQVLVAEDDTGGAIGFALWFTTYSTWLGRPGLYLEDLYVTPDARGSGHGRALLRALARIAVARGYGRVEWSVLNWNEPAIGFYKALGAAPQDDWTVYRLTGEPLATLGAH